MACQKDLPIADISMFRSEELSRPLIQRTARSLREDLHLPEISNDFFSCVLIQVLVRYNWDNLSYFEPDSYWLQHTDSNMASCLYVGAIPEYSKWRNITCDCLDVLHRQALSVSAAAAGDEAHSFLHLHLARLVILAPMRELFSHANVISADFNTLPHELFNGTRISNMAPAILRTWVLQDRFKARLAVIHAGAMLWHVRRYSCDSFLEPFAIYASAMILCTYSRVTTEQKTVSGAPPSQNEDTSHVRDDCGVSQQDENSPGVMSASKHLRDRRLQQDPTLIILDRPVDDELVQHFIRAGNKMTIILESVPDLCTHEGYKQILGAAASLLEALSSTWVVANSYSTSLRALASSTE